MGKKTDVDNVVDDLVGGSAPAPATNAAAPAAAPAAKKKVPAKKKAAPAPAAAAPAATKAQPTKKAATGPKENKSQAPAANKKVPATPAKKANKTPAKKAAKASTGERSPRGQGKFYMSPEERTKIANNLAKLKTPTTTQDFAGKHDLPTWKVRLAAVTLVGQKKMALKKDGAVLVMHPK